MCAGHGNHRSYWVVMSLGSVGEECWAVLLRARYAPVGHGCNGRVAAVLAPQEVGLVAALRQANEHGPRQGAMGRVRSTPPRFSVLLPARRLRQRRGAGHHGRQLAWVAGTDHVLAPGPLQASKGYKKAWLLAQGTLSVTCFLQRSGD